MKNFIICLIAIIFFSFTNILSQETDTFNSHIGINVFSLKYVGKDGDYLFFENKPCILNGIIYQKDYKYFSSRYSLTYNRFKTEVGSIDIIDGYTGFHYHTIWSISSGIQKNHRFNKMVLFYGLDLCNNLIIHKTDLSGGLAGEEIHDKDYDDWLGLAPIIGFQYNITKQISLSIESSYTLVTIVISTDYNNEIARFQHYLNPINAFAIFYNF